MVNVASFTYADDIAIVSTTATDVILEYFDRFRIGVNAAKCLFIKFTSKSVNISIPTSMENSFFEGKYTIKYLDSTAD